MVVSERQQLEENASVSRLRKSLVSSVVRTSSLEQTGALPPMHTPTRENRDGEKNRRFRSRQRLEQRSERPGDAS